MICYQIAPRWANYQYPPEVLIYSKSVLFDNEDTKYYVYHLKNKIHLEGWEDEEKVEEEDEKNPRKSRLDYFLKWKKGFQAQEKFQKQFQGPVPTIKPVDYDDSCDKLCQTLIKKAKEEVIMKG
mmetsp:Transcript_22594/g.35140  ORF Transcript_22594/g.35140 Transcript_22594/m.35140 type:complete len:124 (-) Transcript_22594:84-455(-)